ncbi:MAG: aminomethyltransferase family protein [Caldilinea sp.]|nr:aminomethyltransferase family protein [Caldilineaceae bacterium]MCB9116638.1 aminomethyl transferase family protein [Caldilineaceae bacterium]MCB9118744.1 aminomethyl transferase family protein [Caldilineaceae bacterium]MCO5212206.1 aminomethyltransferase family protein [Caldilinea sp.]MCW5845263.1 aminomethyltransferase family protein [Caldilinea sp.]
MAERRSPLYEIHARSAVRMVKGGGDYMFPLAYTSPAEEHLNVRKNVGMQDLTSMGEVDIKGPGAERLISRLAVASIYDLHPGQVRYTTLCRPDGRIVDDVTVYKFGDEHFMIVTSSAPRKTSFRWIAEHAAGTSAYINDVSGAIALISVQGPQSRDLLAAVAADSAALLALKFFRFAANRINDTELLISRSGYTGELGYELYVPAEEAAVLWEFLERRGKEFGLLPYGVGAMQSLRVEKAFPLAGPDIDGDQTPFEVGLSRWIDFGKRDFIGRDALLSIQDRGLHERWVGLEVESPTPAALNDPIYSVADVKSYRETIHTGSEAGAAFDAEEAGYQQIGRVTSSAKGHSVGKMLALGYLSVSHSWPGAKVMVLIGGRPCLATVVSTPFFDPAGNRLRGSVVRTLAESASPASTESGTKAARKKR